MSEMTATRTLGILALAAAAALWLVLAALLWRTDVPADLRLPELRGADVFSAAELERTADYARVSRALWIGATIAQLAVLAALGWRGPALARRLRGRLAVRALLLLLLVLAAAWLARLPFAAVGHWWRRRHGLSRQGYVDWLTAPWAERAATVALLGLALVTAIALARRFGSRWWLPGGALLAVFGTAAVLAQPLVLAPRLDPLRDRALTADIRSLARGLGLGEVDVEVKDASERTTTANAEVAGIGPTRRVVLWDTLLDGRFTSGEIRFVAAHEIAHVARRHLWKGLAWFALLALPCVYVLARVTDRRGGIAQPAAVPLAALTVVLLELALLPGANAISRRYEAEADWVALEATRDPASARGLLRRFSQTSLAAPEPPAWSYALRSTHPSLLERIAMADAWATTERRSRGEFQAGS
jgi:STE24 endopeptidase